MNGGVSGIVLSESDLGGRALTARQSTTLRVEAICADGFAHHVVVPLELVPLPVVFTGALVLTSGDPEDPVPVLGVGFWVWTGAEVLTSVPDPVLGPL